MSEQLVHALVREGQLDSAGQFTVRAVRERVVRPPHPGWEMLIRMRRKLRLPMVGVSTK